MCLGADSQVDHILFMQQFFTLFHENYLCIKLEKCELLREAMEYLGCGVWYG